MNTTQIGSIGETRIIYEATLRGYNVFLPVNNSLSYDMIVERNGKLERVQVKTVNSNGVVINVSTFSLGKHKNGKKQAVCYSSSEFEWLVVFDITTNACFFVPSTEMMAGKLALRLAPPKSKQKVGIRWGSDYLKW